jgi:pimeloyl-ACP methyl ester carboxylesterase
VDYALQASLVTSDTLRESYDIVGFDPRGVARSAGVDCLDDPSYDQFAAADPSPEDPAELAELEALAGELAQGCADDRVAPFVDTVSAARDMDVLRAVLGDADLNFLGKSYGTVLGAMYAELFPDRVGRLVLDGAVDLTRRPADDTTLAVEQAKGFEVALESFVADCLTQADCPLTGSVQEGVGQVQALLASLETAPLPTGDEERPLTQGLGLFALIGPLYQYDLWPALRAGLDGALAGDGEVLLFINDLFADRREDGTYRGNTGEAIYAVNCVDGGGDAEGLRDLTVADFAELADLLQTEAPTFGPQLAYGGLPCLTWPHAPAEWPEIDGEGAPEIVVIGTSRDPATPLVWAERLSEQLTSGVLITYDGDGHTAYGQTGSACVDEAVDAFFVEGTVPEDGLACVADY